MSFRRPALAPVRGARITVHRRRRCRLLGTVLAIALAAAAFAQAPHLLAWMDRTPRSGLPRSGTRTASAGGGYPSSVLWPRQGEAALMVGNRRPVASPHEASVAIASLAKVMTAYLTLERYPLSGTQQGFTTTITAADAEDEAKDAGEGQSGVAVTAGEQLTERELLEALLIPSGNNIAEILANQVAGSEADFIAEMNAKARELGMTGTIYTDPSGLDPSTVSTAVDQLRIFDRAMRFWVFRQIVATASVTLPVAGTLANFDPLIAKGYPGKTGSDSQAGGCLAFFTNVTVGGRQQTAVGVVLGQGRGNDTSVLLAAAGEAALQLVDSAVPAIRVRTIRSPGRRPPIAGTPHGRLSQPRVRRGRWSPT
jgi:D-alanyl-D-alanine carboxypeptidase (penicillin-binding protein 5/6)